MKARTYTPEHEEIGRKVTEARDWSMITGHPLPYAADLIARLEIDGCTVDLLTGEITRADERAAPPTDAGRALVATWQRAAAAVAGAMVALAIFAQAAQAAPSCPAGGRPDARGRCTIMEPARRSQPARLCGWPAVVGGRRVAVCVQPAPQVERRGQ